MRKIFLLASIMLFLFAGFSVALAATPQFTFAPADRLSALNVEAGKSAEKEFLLSNRDPNVAITLELLKGGDAVSGWASFPSGTEFRIAPLGSVKASVKVSVPADTKEGQYKVALKTKLKDYEKTESERNSSSGAGVSVSSAVGYKLALFVKEPSNLKGSLVIPNAQNVTPIIWVIIAILAIAILVLGSKYFPRRKKETGGQQ